MKMRNLILLFALVSIVIFPGALCSHSDSSPTIHIGVPTTMDFPVNIPAVDKKDTTLSIEASVEKNIESLIQSENNSFGIENIESVDIDSVGISIDSDSREFGDNNLTAFQSFEASFSSNVKPTPVTVANIQNPTHKYEESITTVSNVALKDYFDASEFTLKIEAQTKRAITHDLNATVTIKFIINAKN